MVHLTVRGERLNIGTSIAPYTNEFRLGKLKNQGVINKLQVFVNRCSRKILKLKWTDKIRNEQLWERTGQVPIQTEIGRRRWNGLDIH